MIKSQTLKKWFYKLTGRNPKEDFNLEVVEPKPQPYLWPKSDFVTKNAPVEEPKVEPKKELLIDISDSVTTVTEEVKPVVVETPAADEEQVAKPKAKTPRPTQTKRGASTTGKKKNESRQRKK